MFRASAKTVLRLSANINAATKLSKWAKAAFAAGNNTRTVGTAGQHTAAPQKLAASELKPETTIRGVQADDAMKCLRVEFDNGKVGVFPYVWLRDCAPAPRTYENCGRAGERRVLHLSELDLNVKPESVSVGIVPDQMQNGKPVAGIKVQWPPYYCVGYPVTFLQAHSGFCFTAEDVANVTAQSAAAAKSESWEIPVPWNREKMNDGKIPTYQDEDLLRDDCSLASCLKEFLRYGVVRVEGEAWRKHTAQLLLERMGIPAENLAACPSSFDQALDDVHTGMPYICPPPPLVILRIRSEPQGGCFQFVDGFNVAQLMEKHHPLEFQVLCETVIDYTLSYREPPQAIGDEFLGNKFPFAGAATKTAAAKPQPAVSSYRVFNTDDAGVVQSVVFNNSFRMSKVNLAGKEMDHLQSGFKKLSEFYNALKTFHKLCYDSANMVNLTTKKGDMVILANDRVLHGHTAFNNRETNWIDESFCCAYEQDPLKRRLKDLISNGNGNPDAQPAGDELAKKSAEQYHAEIMPLGAHVGGIGSHKRAKKDPNAPKRALSAFFFFSQEKRPDIQQAHPDWKVGQVAQELGRMWKDISEDTKRMYEQMNTRDKVRYEAEMKEYKATGTITTSRRGGGGGGASAFTHDDDE